MKQGVKLLLLKLGVIGALMAQTPTPILIPPAPITAYTALPGDPCFSSNSLVWPSPNLQWAPSFTCTIPNVAAGIYSLVLTFQEPTVAAAGLRVFTVGYNGQISQPIDLFSAAGTAIAQMYAQILVTFSGPVVFTFSASVRNAVVSEIDLAISPNLNVPPVWICCQAPPAVVN